MTDSISSMRRLAAKPIAQLGQIAQRPHAEVVGIVDGGFGTQARTAHCPFCDTA